MMRMVVCSDSQQHGFRAANGKPQVWEIVTPSLWQNIDRDFWIRKLTEAGHLMDKIFYCY